MRDPSRGSAGLPDLVLSQFSYFDVAEQGENVLVVLVENKGGPLSFPPGTAINVHVFPPLSGLKENEFLPLELQNNGKEFAPQPLLTSETVFTSSENYFIQVDFDNAVPESNEDNNCGFYDPAKNTVTPAPCRAYPQK